MTTARLDRHGNIVLELDYAEGQPGGGTLGYIVSRGRNVRLDLVYTITQNTPLDRRHGARSPSELRAGGAVEPRGGRLQLPRLAARG